MSFTLQLRRPFVPNEVRVEYRRRAFGPQRGSSRNDASQQAGRFRQPEAIAVFACRYVAVFRSPITGNPRTMHTLTRLRHVQQQVVRVQRRVWLGQVLLGLTALAAGLVTIGGIVWFVRRPAGGRHEMPDFPGAHETGTVHVESDGQQHL
jgi:hypothetical protein